MCFFFLIWSFFLIVCHIIFISFQDFYYSTILVLLEINQFVKNGQLLIKYTTKCQELFSLYEKYARITSVDIEGSLPMHKNILALNRTGFSDNN